MTDYFGPPQLPDAEAVRGSGDRYGAHDAAGRQWGKILIGIAALAMLALRGYCVVDDRVVGFLNDDADLFQMVSRRTDVHDAADLRRVIVEVGATHGLSVDPGQIQVITIPLNYERKTIGSGNLRQTVCEMEPKPAEWDKLSDQAKLHYAATTKKCMGPKVLVGYKATFTTRKFFMFKRLPVESYVALREFRG